MSPDPYSDPELIALYDIDNPDGPDHDHYRHLADDIQAETVIDLGCGTGLLTRTLATTGRTVSGVDPSINMLRFARRQPGADAVHWIHGDATALPQDGAADLVLITGNAIQHITTDELPSTLTRIASSLRPGGVLSFESRNPSAREWERWTPEATLVERKTSFGHLREWLEVIAYDGAGRVVFDVHNVIDGRADRVFTSVLFFRTAEEFVAQLTVAGFTDVSIAGDWQGNPLAETSRVIVVRAARA